MINDDMRQDRMKAVVRLCVLCIVAASFVGSMIAGSSGAFAQNKAALAENTKVTIDSEKALGYISGQWFDKAKEGYRPPVLSRPIDDSIRRHGWVGKAKQTKNQWNWGNWSWASLGFTGEMFGWIVLAVLGTVLLTGLIMIAYHYWGDYIPAIRRKSDNKQTVKIDPTRVEELPFEVPVVSNDPLSQAEALMRAGRYNEAVVYLYGYMLLVLDQARKLHLQKGKTNRMYLRELRNEQRLQAIVSKTMLAFEDVFFGRYDIDSARFEMLWEQRDEFHSLLRDDAAAASGSGGANLEAAAV